MARARRPHGTGSVYYDDARKRWVGSIELGWTAKGTRRRRRFVAATEAGVRRKIREALTEAEAAEAPTVGGKPTVKRWADVWMENTAATLRPTTWNANRSAVTQWIIPTIGHRRLDQLAPADIRAFHRAMEAKPLALSSQARYHAALSAMLSAAVQEGHAVPERARMVEGPGLGTNDRDALPLDDALAILEVASRRPDASRWAAALLQGMRPAETLGLTWDMVDLDDKEPTLTLAWQLKPLPYRVTRDRSSGFRVPRGFEARQVDGALHLVRPKTKSGWRVIPLVPWMVASLTAWREVAPPNRHGLVWPQADGRPQRDDDDRAAWYSITDEAHVAVTEPSPRQDGPEIIGRRPDLYEARHTAATLLRMGGVDDATITAILGHASILSTKAYLHTDRTRTRAALVDVAGRLGLTS
ncbi:tyrosine-type recombinase/integrase [Isoptericola sp. NPDC056605]|uniref:tyrosine-type recombinase/integrase n=1 Tax=Isoptericola sp. NPDC056605 TaxID=3345876 RepID=UPI0036CA34A5